MVLAVGFSVAGLLPPELLLPVQHKGMGGAIQRVMTQKALQIPFGIGGVLSVPCAVGECLQQPLRAAVVHIQPRLKSPLAGLPRERTVKKEHIRSLGADQRQVMVV